MAGKGKGKGKSKSSRPNSLKMNLRKVGTVKGKAIYVSGRTSCKRKSKKK